MSIAPARLENAFDRLLSAIEQAGFKVTDRTANRARSQCPAHGDSTSGQNLSIFSTESRVNTVCHSNGCETLDVLEAVGLAVADRYHERRTEYRYDDGRTVYRTPDKRFSQSGNKAGTPTLYRAAKVAAAVADRVPVLLVEGEEDVHAGEAIGAAATTAPMGAKSFAKVDVTPLTGAQVVAVVDRDEQGSTWAAQVAERVGPVAQSLRFVHAKTGKDLTDHLSAGHELADLVPLEVDGPPDPLPLVRTVALLPFPVDQLPPAIADMIEAVAEATQTDPAMAATTALTVLAAAACGRAEIQARAGWREVLALHTATVAKPGERKSAVQDILTRPLRDAEASLVESVAEDRRSLLVEAQIAAKVAERAENEAVKTGDVHKAQDARRIADDAAAKVPALPRLFADDVTPEALSSLLAEQGGRMAVISAEGGIFDIIAGRYSNGVANMDTFLKGHAGDTLRVDRKGRPAEHVQRPALTIGVMIQPNVLATIGEHRQFRGRGLLARFLYARPVSLVGRRKAGAESVPHIVRDAYERKVRELALDLAQQWEPVILELSADAQRLLIALEEHIEPQLAEDGQLGTLADWGSKLLGAILRITALVHLAEHGTSVTRVSRECLERGYRIGEYFRAQASAAFADMQTDVDTADAVYLLDKIRAYKDGPLIPLREMLRIARRFKTREELETPVRRLVDHGWLMPVESEPTGGRRSERYRIHPAAHSVGDPEPDVTRDKSDRSTGNGSTGDLLSLLSRVTPPPDPEKSPTCAACGFPLSTRLAAAGETTHPTCEDA